MKYASGVANPTAASRDLTSCCDEIYTPSRDAQMFCEECNCWFHASCLNEKPEFGKRIPKLVDNDYDALSGAVLLDYLTSGAPIVQGKCLQWPGWKVGGTGHWVELAREHESETRRPTRAVIMALIPTDDMARKDIFLTCAGLPFYECRICEGRL